MTLLQLEPGTLWLSPTWLTVTVPQPPEVLPPCAAKLAESVAGVGTALKHCAVTAPGQWIVGPVQAMKVTVLSVLVEGLLPLPKESCTTPVGMVAITVPLAVIPLTATV